MIDLLKGWILNIVTISIFIVLIEILVPSGKMKKFVNLVSGFILIIAIIKPVTGALHEKGYELLDFQVSGSNFIDKKEIEESSKVLKDSQMKQVAEVYRKKIIGYLEDNAMDIKGVSSAQADVIINEDYKSDTFGEIKRAYVSLVLTQKDGDVKPVSKVREVRLSEKPEKSTEGSGEGKNSGIRKAVENKISSLLGVQKDKIVISIQE